MKTYKASILLSTIIVLSVILVTVLSLIFVSNLSQNASSSSNESLLAYQRADEGVERTLAVIVAGKKTSFNSTSWGNIGNGCQTSGAMDGLILKTDTDGNYFKIELLQRDPSDPANKLMKIDCDASGKLFSDIVAVKSVGIIPGKTQRSIKAVAPVPAP